MLKKGDRMTTYCEVNKEVYDYWYKLFGIAPYKLTYQINNVIFNPPATLYFGAMEQRLLQSVSHVISLIKRRG